MNPHTEDYLTEHQKGKFVALDTILSTDDMQWASTSFLGGDGKVIRRYSSSTYLVF